MVTVRVVYRAGTCRACHLLIAGTIQKWSFGLPPKDLTEDRKLFATTDSGIHWINSETSQVSSLVNWPSLKASRNLKSLAKAWTESAIPAEKKEASPAAMSSTNLLPASSTAWILYKAVHNQGQFTCTVSIYLYIRVRTRTHIDICHCRCIWHLVDGL